MARARQPDKEADPLGRYRAKRDFTQTSEPSGAPVRHRSAKPRFVVQMHAARRLHHDFRLEIGGVLASWAVTRPPSRDPKVRRLAVRTEDHPLDYAEFEGVIPAGSYGAGTVLLWDAGTCRVEGDAAEGLRAGKLHIHLEGRRMRGEWALVKIKPKAGERGEPWLLMKVADDQAAPADAADPEPRSVATGRTMAEIKAGAPARVAAALPPFRPVQLAQLAARVPEGPGWLHEIKHDGYRALCALGGGTARIHTRSGLDWTGRFPRVAVALARLPVASALIDGELVVQDAEGRSRFGLLQAALAENRDADVRFIAFDLLALDGEALTETPLRARKDRLATLRLDGVLGYSDHHEGDGAPLLASACESGLEGLVSKRADSLYLGRRSGDWVKVKCTARDRFKIVGWLPSGARAFRSLLLARETADGLAYAGKVGTGFSQTEQADLLDRLVSLETSTPSVEALARDVRGARWVRPALEGEVAFAEVTNEGVLRHASWTGLASPPTRRRPRPRPPPAPPADDLSWITNADRLVFPEAGVSKGELVAYYTALAPAFLAFGANRYLSLVRCPEGREKSCFFQKHAGSGFEGVRQSPPDAADKRWLYVDDATGVLRCVQMGTVEFHGWGARADRPDHPDRLVMDLDPDLGTGFADLKSAAFAVRDTLADLGLESWPMLTGGKGIHVVAPLDTAADWVAVKDFARRFARAMALAEPDRFTVELSKAKRGTRIFLDWLRNQKGATAVMPWSVRARPGAPVATLLSWDALRRMKSHQPFTLSDVAAIQRQASRSAGWGEVDQRLPAA